MGDVVLVLVLVVFVVVVVVRDLLLVVQRSLGGAFGGRLGVGLRSLGGSRLVLGGGRSGKVRSEGSRGGGIWFGIWV